MITQVEAEGLVSSALSISWISKHSVRCEHLRKKKQKNVLQGLQDIPWVSDAMLPSEQNPAQADILLCYIQPRSMTETLIRESDLAACVFYWHSFHKRKWRC